ncbi:MAG: L,D-transpeptidase [Rhizobiaceae bacterium]|nr:L,D-transpeptidase [Rhizobiaceae bacterium]
MTHFNDHDAPISRRGFLGASAIGAASFLAACTTRRDPPPEPPAPPPATPHYAAMYGQMTDGGFVIPAVPIEKLNSRYYRQEVRDPTGQAPGTVVVDTSSHFLYHVMSGGRAMRYGVGLGRAGFEWAGSAVIQWKKKWPTWTPPAEMILRKPELERYSAANGGMPPGLDNPLGARAHYIFQDGVDTLYRVHGSPEWWSIGQSVSSGCVRMINQDVIDLYERVKPGSPIVVGSGFGVA